MPKKKGEDPAFLFYPADASEDTQFMNRLERGCYFDILKAQKKFRRFSLDQIKRVLGKDFDKCWASIKIVLGHDSEGYFITWADLSIERRKSYSAIQSARIQQYWDEKRSSNEDSTEVPRNTSGSSPDIPLGTGIGTVSNTVFNKDSNIDSDNSKKGSEKKIEVSKPHPLFRDMVAVFREGNPRSRKFGALSDEYFCGEIANHIAEANGWTKESVTNGKADVIFHEFVKAMEFAKTERYSYGKTLKDLSDGNEWSRLYQKVDFKPTTNEAHSRNSTSKSTTSKNAGAIELLDKLQGDLGINQ